MILHSPRRELADRIRAWDLVPAVYDGAVAGDSRSLTVYGAPPAGVDPPAVVIAAGSPYFMRTGFDHGEWRLVVALIVARTGEDFDVSAVEDWWTALWGALDSEPVAEGMAMSLSPVGSVTIAGNHYLFSQTDFAFQQ